MINMNMNNTKTVRNLPSIVEYDQNPLYLTDIGKENKSKLARYASIPRIYV